MDHPPVDPAAILRRWLATAAGLGLVLAGLVLATRLAAGRLSTAHPRVILGTALAAIALVRLADLGRTTAAARLVPISARAGLAITAVALALAPGTGGLGDWVSRTILAAAAGAMLLVPRSEPRRGAARRRPATRSFPGPREPGRITRGLRQRLERFERPDGTDTLRGTLVVSVARGARAGHGHVGFCPSFAALPTVAVSTRYDGPDATVTAAEVLPWGVRIECRLADAAEEPLEIPVTLVARLGPALS